MNFLKDNLDVIKFLTEIIFIIFAFICFFVSKTICRRTLILKNNEKDNPKLENFSAFILPIMKKKNNTNEEFIALDYKLNTKKFINQLKKSTEGSKLIYIVGEGGAGKSTLTNYIYRRLCKKKIKNTIALYIPIKKLNNIENPMFNYLYSLTSKTSEKITLFDGKMKLNLAINNWNQLLELLTKYSTLYIFIDGYDEIIYTESNFDAIDKEIREIIAYNNDNVKLVISSRHEPKLYTETKPLTLNLNKLTDDQKEVYIGKEQYADLDENISEIISTPLLLTMYKEISNENIINSDNNIINIKKIKTATDIYWKNYCYYWEKIKIKADGRENAKVVFAKYIVPFIAYNLEYKKIENSFTLNDIKDYTNKFFINFDCFKQNFDIKCSKEDINDLLNSDDFEQNYLSELSVIENERQGKYKFSHLMQRNFFAAVYEFYKDYCILETDYSTASITYKPYEFLDDKVTIHTITRVFYSNLISLYINDRTPLDFPNVVKYYCVVSDLHYFGDSELFKMDKEAALNESINGFDFCKRCCNNEIDELSKKWLAWNLAFIIFDRLIKKGKNVAYTDSEIEIAKRAIEALKYGMSVDYAPTYDKFARIYNTVLFERFVKEDILVNKEDIPDESEKTEKIKKLLDKACECNYHFSFNSYGALLEKEGNIDEAFEKFKRSVECDPLEFYARSRCGLHLIHNYDQIKYYKESFNGKSLAYKDAEKYLKEGFKYYNAVKYNKPYELQGITNLISNLAEYYLILYLQDKTNKKSFLRDAFDYYNVLFNIHEKALENDSNKRENIFSNADVMRDFLCFCIVGLYLNNKSEKELIIEDVINKSFDDLCKIVHDYYENILIEAKTSQEKYPFSYHPVFHFERFKKYYDVFVNLYKEGQNDKL